MRSFLCTMFIAVLLLYSALAIAIINPSEQEILDWISDQAQTHIALADKYQEVNDSYEIVFIPGILGSKLTIDKLFTYGEDSINSQSLIFRPGQNVQPSTLNNFNAFKKVDIYGSGLDLLQASIQGKELNEFSYDWRDNIDTIADRFQTYVEAKLKSKRVIIVAHSMGGVVAWHWKNKFVNKIPFNLIAMVLLGSPLQGSCEPAKMLIEGYRAIEGANTFDKLATKLVFSDAHAAIFTFPSVYQLLPKFSDKKPCLYLQKDGFPPLPLDHFNPNTWLGSGNCQCSCRLDG